MAESKQIEDSVKKAQAIPPKGDTKKNVCIALPVINETSKESILSEKSEGSIIQPDDEAWHKVETKKMTMVITPNGSKYNTSSMKPPKSRKPNIDSSSALEDPQGDENMISECPSNRQQPTRPPAVGTQVSKGSLNRMPSNGSFNLKPRRSEEIEAVVKKVVLSKVQETITVTVAQNLEATVNKVVAERINETVQRAVSQKIAQAVTQIEDSVKKVVSNQLPMIEEEEENMPMPFSDVFEEFNEQKTRTFPKKPSRIVLTSVRESA